MSENNTISLPQKSQEDAPKEIPGWQKANLELITILEARAEQLEKALTQDQLAAITKCSQYSTIPVSLYANHTQDLEITRQLIKTLSIGLQLCDKS